MPIPTEAILVVLIGAAVLPLYGLVDRLGGRLRSLERRLLDATMDATDGARADRLAEWRGALAALETDGQGAGPRASALRRRLEIAGQG